MECLEICLNIPFLRYLPLSFYSMATEKKAFVLRISPEMLKELEQWAQEEFRSTNGQIEYVLSDALKKRKRASKQPKSPASLE